MADKNKQSRWQAFKAGQEKGAKEHLEEEFFYDVYQRRRSIYWVNFIRGIFFGFASVIGGTLVVAIIIWVISWFVGFPLVGQYFKELLNAVQQGR